MKPTNGTKSDGSFLGAIAQGRPRRGRELLASLLVHAALLAVAVTLSIGASAASEADPVMLTFFDAPPAPEPPGGGEAPAPALPEPVEEAPVEEPRRVRRPQPLTFEDPSAMEEDIFDPNA